MTTPEVSPGVCRGGGHDGHTFDAPPESMVGSVATFGGEDYEATQDRAEAPDGGQLVIWRPVQSS